MGNIVLSNKHEQFSNEFLYGKNKGNAGRCYAEVYHNGEMTPNCYSHGSRLLTREDVSQYLEIKRDELMKVAEFRQISNVQTLTDIIEECATYKPTDINGTELSPHLVRATAIKAIETQNKMLGLNKEKTDINVNGGILGLMWADSIMNADVKVNSGGTLLINNGVDDNGRKKRG